MQLSSNLQAEVLRLTTLLEENLHGNGEDEGGNSLRSLAEDVLDTLNGIKDVIEEEREDKEKEFINSFVQWWGGVFNTFREHTFQYLYCVLWATDCDTNELEEIAKKVYRNENSNMISVDFRLKDEFNTSANRRIVSHTTGLSLYENHEGDEFWRCDCETPFELQDLFKTLVDTEEFNL